MSFQLKTGEDQKMKLILDHNLILVQLFGNNIKNIKMRKHVQKNVKKQQQTYK